MPHRRRRGGNAVLEFALSFTFLWLVFTGTFQFGYTLYLYNALVTRVANGARYASLRECRGSQWTSYENAVKSYVVYGDDSNAGVPAVAGLTPGQIAVTPTYSSTDPETRVLTHIRVSVQSYTIDAIFGQFTFQNKPAVTMEYLGLYAN